ncbi:hypothetical protein JTE90_006309 [Oedothorax gibbosus]|uniref:Uncharacterized protein n=1 Tax=Oedothorax gibbosus TaxID=931172 RepID=A0AAV6U1W4_9ARAC|nr:hypothetical protein JTE90_006309 [Oedothorax gibbosus]
MLHCFVRFLMLPFLSLALVVFPWFRPLKKYHSPRCYHLLRLVFYLIFLLMVFLPNHLDTGKFNKVPPHTGVEDCILCGLKDRQHKRKVLERKFWRGDDAALLHEALFSVGIVLAFGNLAYFYQQSSRLGSFQVSMSRMVLQSAYFMGFCLIVITTSAIAPTRMYEFYDGMKRNDKGGNTRTQWSTFSTFGNSFHTLFWGMFGVSPAESTNVVIKILSPEEGVTEGTGTALFAFYEIIMIISLVESPVLVIDTNEDVTAFSYRDAQMRRPPDLDILHPADLVNPRANRL